MASFHGKNGRAYWDGAAGDVLISQITSWTVTATADVAEITDMGDSWKSYVGGFQDWTATIESNLPTTGTQIPWATNGTEAFGEGNAVELELWLDDTSELNKILYGLAHVTGISVIDSKDDVVKATYAFQGSEVLTWTTTDPN